MKLNGLRSRKGLGLTLGWEGIWNKKEERQEKSTFLDPNRSGCLFSRGGLGGAEGPGNVVILASK